LFMGKKDTLPKGRSVTANLDTYQRGFYLRGVGGKKTVAKK